MHRAKKFFSSLICSLGKTFSEKKGKFILCKLKILIIDEYFKNFSLDVDSLNLKKNLLLTKISIYFLSTDHLAVHTTQNEKIFPSQTILLHSCIQSFFRSLANRIVPKTFNPCNHVNPYEGKNSIFDFDHMSFIL